MSTCHQAHNIPWNSFLELLGKEPWGNPNESFTQMSGSRFDLTFTPDTGGKVFKKIKFFASKIHSAIKEFSRTERQKYDNAKLDGVTRLYENEMCNEWAKEGELQEVSGWEQGFGQNCLETLKELFLQEKVDSLLCLARRGIRLETLQFVTYSNFFHYGIGRIKEDCLTLYIHLNILLASGTLQDSNQWYEQWRRFRQQEILNRYDGNSQRRLYHEYFEKNAEFQDLDGLQALLKKLFRMLYIYDMVMTERGIVLSWEGEVLDCVGSYFLSRTKQTSNLWYQQRNAAQQ